MSGSVAVLNKGTLNVANNQGGSVKKNRIMWHLK